MTHARSPRRGGFTLVELLVAMALAILLMALAVGVAGSDAFGSYKVVRSGDRVSGWLLIAKSRAIRDGQPRGVRFFRNADGTFTQAQYIEVPDAWVPNPLQEANPTGGRIVFSYKTNGTTPPVNVTEKRVFFVRDDGNYTDFALNVKGGDVLTLPELGGAYRLDPVTPWTAQNVTVGGTSRAARELLLKSPYDAAYQRDNYPNLGAAHYGAGATPEANLTTYKFAFGGSPRPLFGEPALLIPEGTSIVSPPASTGVKTKGVDPSGNFDVMFLPSGQVVVGNAAGSLTRPSEIVVLWIWDDLKQAAGEQALVSVYMTGQIATHPAAPGADPYQYVKDGLYTGGL